MGAPKLPLKVGMMFALFFNQEVILSIIIISLIFSGRNL